MDSSQHSVGSIGDSSSRRRIGNPFDETQWRGFLNDSMRKGRAPKEGSGTGELITPLIEKSGDDDDESVFSEEGPGEGFHLRETVSSAFEFPMNLCPIATAVFAEVYKGVDPPQYLATLLEASGAEFSENVGLDLEGGFETLPETRSFSVMADDSSQKAVRFGAEQCSKIGKFLESYGFSGLPPRPRSEMPRRVLYIGIPCFTEHPDEIIPTVESILRNGGDDALRVHVVLCGDVAINPTTKERINQTPFGVSWTRLDKKFSMTFLNKGLKAFTGKTSSLYMLSKYVRARMKVADDVGDETPDTLKPLKTYLLMADTRIIYGEDSITLLMEYMQRHKDVIACTGTQELYPVKWNSTSVEGTEARRLHDRRPTYWQWLGAPAMQQFEFEANYAQGQYAYHMGGRLAILPGPCHFLDMDKIDKSGVFEAFNRDILKYGSELTTSHFMKLYVMAEDRHLSTLYSSITDYKTAWVQGARFYYKPEMSWLDVLQQRLRWQGGTLAQMYVVIFRPAVVGIGGQHWAWWYTLLSACALLQFILCCFGNAVWAMITHLSRGYSPIKQPFRDTIFDAVIWGQLLFPWIWVGWSTAINKKWVKYDNPISSMMIGLSLSLSTVSVVVNALSLANPVCGIVVTDDFFELAPTPAPTTQDFDGDGCEIWNWMKILAVAIALLPVIAWTLTGPSAGFSSISALLRTCIASFFTPILFSMHQYNSTPLHVVARLEDLTWRGNKVMQSEVTKHSWWTQYCGWTVVVIDTLFILGTQASPLNFTRYVYVDKVGFVIFLLFPQLIPMALGFWLFVEYYLRVCFAYIFFLRHE